MNRISCDVIKDVLPLYYDNVCSEATRAIVDEHIAECEACRDLLQKMSIDIALPTEGVEQYKREGMELQQIAKRWNRSKLIAFAKGLIIATSICGILILGYVGLFKWNFISAPTDVFEITDVSQRKDGNIYFQAAQTDGYDLNRVKYTLTDDGNFYMTPLRPVVKSKHQQKLGIFLIGNYNFDVKQQSASRNKEIQAIYWGTPEDRILIWEKGMQLPPASEEVEAEYNN
ncbi:zf-HC2 domain-containing protein [Paenibacillus faecalis]|uniref:zf-HC2 domain-containing protein n=1 Tax=Paenibacillus faecalis TaxID=2079532 RepID=UPI000D1142DC|nr:zf-HC2 domain-containing protein [Paenibacillus faecalis]